MLDNGCEQTHKLSNMPLGQVLVTSQLRVLTYKLSNKSSMAWVNSTALLKFNAFCYD